MNCGLMWYVSQPTWMQSFTVHYMRAEQSLCTACVLNSPFSAHAHCSLHRHTRTWRRSVESSQGLKPNVLAMCVCSHPCSKRPRLPRVLCPAVAPADVALITSLRDGMNLVSYEYVACQADNAGVLVLSEFAGAAQSLGAGGHGTQRRNAVGLQQKAPNRVCVWHTSLVHRLGGLSLLGPAGAAGTSWGNNYMAHDQCKAEMCVMFA